MKLLTLILLSALAAQPATGYDNPDMLASELIGIEVQNLAGEEVGELEDLAVNLENGRVVHAVLDLGGVAGLGETRVAVPLSSLTVGMWDEVLILEETAMRAPPPTLEDGVVRASALLREPPVVDLVVDLERARITQAVLDHAIVPFLDLAGRDGWR